MALPSFRRRDRCGAGNDANHFRYHFAYRAAGARQHRYRIDEAFGPPLSRADLLDRRARDDWSSELGTIPWHLSSETGTQAASRDARILDRPGEAEPGRSQ